MFEADEAQRRARRARGDDSDDSTVGNDDDEENRENSGHIVEVGQGNINLEDEGANEETIEDTIEATIHCSTTSMFRRVLMFSDGTSNSLYDDKMITSFDTLRELDDDTIKETCRAIKKPGGAAMVYQISELSVTRFKLFVFWARHMWRTSRPIYDWTDITWDEVSILKNQKTLEVNLQDRKSPETPVMTLDPQTAAKVFLEMTVLLGKLRGITGIPLSYVVRFILMSPNNLTNNDPIRDNPPFGQVGSPSSSMDDELIARAAILRNNLTHGQLAASQETLESEGPFEPAFMADMVLVYNVLHA